MNKEGFKKDKRKFKRAKINFIITYRIHKPLETRVKFGGEEFHALLLDLSEGGIAISAKQNIPVSTVLLVKLILVDYSTSDKGDRFKERDVIGEVRNNIPEGKDKYHD